MQREELITALKNNVCTVTFTKVNGEVRVMPCTLKEELIPAVKAVKEAVVPDATIAVDTVLKPAISVWCTDASAWRSFRFDSVTQVEINA
jgi:hypothetical protein